MSAWLDFALWTAFLVGLMTVTYEVTQRLTVFGFSVKRALLLGGCIVFAGAFGAVYYWMHVTSADLAVEKSKPYSELPADWGADTPGPQREKSSLAYVSAAFLGQGILLKHVDQSGSWVRFQPSQKEIAERAAAVAVRTQLAEQSRGFAKIALTWWLSCIFAIVFGYLVGRSRVAANSTAESDARKDDARGSP